MSKTPSTARKRVNITLPDSTLRLLDRVSSKGQRSHVIDEAVRAFVSKRTRASLRDRLKEGARARADRDLGISEAWSSAEDVLWPGRRRT